MCHLPDFCEGLCGIESLQKKCTKEKTKKYLKIFKEFLHCKEESDIYLDNFIPSV